jgi:alanine racemase
MAFITLSKAKLFHNLDFLCAKAGGKHKVMAVLKDNAYGHGLEMVAALIREYGITKIAVKNLQEASLVCSLFDETLVLVDHPTCNDIPANVTLAIHSYEALLALPPKTSLHLALDTGMHRNGIKVDEIDKALEAIIQKDLALKGMFTHFRSADEVSSDFFWQRAMFEEAKCLMKSSLQHLGLPPIVYHSHNSAALLRTSDLGSDDFARCGIALYGYTTLHPLIAKPELHPVMALWAQKLSTRILKKGERVGYGGVYEALEDECISTYDIGYGDGFFRFDGARPVRMANAKLSKGKMSMDSFCLGGDASEVCLFEDANALAEHFGTISYEIITKFSPALKRIVI